MRSTTASTTLSADAVSRSRMDTRDTRSSTRVSSRGSFSSPAAKCLFTRVSISDNLELVSVTVLCSGARRASCCARLSILPSVVSTAFASFAAKLAVCFSRSLVESSTRLLEAAQVAASGILSSSSRSFWSRSPSFPAVSSRVARKSPVVVSRACSNFCTACCSCATPSPPPLSATRCLSVSGRWAAIRLVLVARSSKRSVTSASSSRTQASSAAELTLASTLRREPTSDPTSVCTCSTRPSMASSLPRSPVSPTSASAHLVSASHACSANGGSWWDTVLWTSVSAP
mmetsp:Transcript_26651/g.64184  ORF Transcript_26651/g.64184 Transcript_26651/m.64184 type:complete len:287 (+) Transcript_26651:2252-3112(+)